MICSDEYSKSFLYMPVLATISYLSKPYSYRNWELITIRALVPTSAKGTAIKRRVTESNLSIRIVR